MTEQAKALKVQVDSPELTEFKRKVWFTAQRIMTSHGYEEAIQEILEELGIRTEDVMGDGFQEPEAEGMYRLEGASQDVLVIKAHATGYENGQHWFITSATTPRASSYDPVVWGKIVQNLISNGHVSQENDWQLNLVKA